MIENDAMMQPRQRRDAGNATVSSEAWDHTHPDHDWWVNGRTWCYDAECDRHGPRPA